MDNPRINLDMKYSNVKDYAVKAMPRELGWSNSCDVLIIARKQLINLDMQKPYGDKPCLV